MTKLHRIAHRSEGDRFAGFVSRSFSKSDIKIFHKQTGLLHSEQKKKEHAYRKRRISWMKFFLGTVALTFSVTSTGIELQTGYQEVSPQTSKKLPWSSLGLGTSPVNKPGWYVIPYPAANWSEMGITGLITVADTYPTNAECPGNTYPLASYDGYTGFEIAPGILVIPFGSLTGPVRWEPGYVNQPDNIFVSKGPVTSYTSAASWDRTGKGTGDFGNVTRCLSLSFPSPGDYAATEMNTSGGSSSNIGYGVYVRPQAPPMGTKTVYTQIGRGLRFNTTPSTFDRRALSLTYSAISCTINTPAVVAFGDVMAGQSSGGKGIAVDSTFDVACTNPAQANLAITYSVSPKTQAGNEFTIPMISTGGGIAGDIRGFLGSSASADAGCADKISSVRMDNTPVLLRNISKTETWSSPLTWVLCPRGDAKPGTAKAIATIELNW